MLCKSTFNEVPSRMLWSSPHNPGICQVWPRKWNNCTEDSLSVGQHMKDYAGVMATQPQYPIDSESPNFLKCWRMYFVPDSRILCQFAWLSCYSNGVDSWGSGSWEGHEMFLVLGFTHPPVERLPEVKWLGRVTNDPPSCNAEVTNSGAVPSLPHTSSWSDNWLSTGITSPYAPTLGFTRDTHNYHIKPVT
jgi:hypothetical protein